jgi:predicted nucleic acid-binding protein
MALSEIRSGASVFVDASILIYHFTGFSDECSAFLSRVERGDLQASTGATTVLEVAHRLMMFEAAEHGLATPHPAARLAKRPDLVRNLAKYHFQMSRIYDWRLAVLPLPDNFLAKSHEYRHMHGLLINDSLVPMYMREAGIATLASADSSFDRIPWIKRVGPSDL